MIHRPDYLGDVDEIAAAFARLRDQGKARWFGVSNFRPSQVAALWRACDFPLVAQQVEVSLGALSTLEDGTLDQCVAERITPLAWSPLAKGALLATPRDEREARLHSVLDETAARHGTTRSVIALAWLLRHPARMIPIIGSVTPSRIKEAVRADDVVLSREEWYALLVAARGTALP
jgi:predicted oxidoreductase